MPELHHEPSLNYVRLFSLKIKTFSSAFSRSPAPKRQVIKVLASRYMTPTHTGKSHGPRVEELSQVLHCIGLLLIRLPGHPRQAVMDRRPAKWRRGP